MKNIRNIISRSSPAMCGITEREIVVPAGRVAETIRTLKRAGKHIVGVSYGDSAVKTIWFTSGIAL